jgi:hypothetical protein
MKKTTPRANAIVAVPIFVNYHGEGSRGKNGHCPIHELPLLRRRYALTGDTLTIDSDWLPGCARFQTWNADQLEEAKIRLKQNFGSVRHGEKDFDLLTEVYGPGATGLAAAMKRVYDRYREILDAGDEPNIDELKELESLATNGHEAIEIDLPTVNVGGTIEDEDEEALDAELIDELKAHGIGAAKAREVAELVAKGKMTEEKLDELFKGNLPKIQAAQKALAAKVKG